MNVGILGLGLIGGSLARAYALEGHTVYAAQRNQSMLSFAMLAGAVHGKLDESTIPACDLILLAIYPDGSASWLEKNAHLILRATVHRTCTHAYTENETVFRKVCCHENVYLEGSVSPRASVTQALFGTPKKEEKRLTYARFAAKNKKRKGNI